MSIQSESERQLYTRVTSVQIDVSFKTFINSAKQKLKTSERYVSGCYLIGLSCQYIRCIGDFEQALTRLRNPSWRLRCRNIAYRQVKKKNAGCYTHVAINFRPNFHIYGNIFNSPFIHIHLWCSSEFLLHCRQCLCLFGPLPTARTCTGYFNKDVLVPSVTSSLPYTSTPQNISVRGAEKSNGPSLDISPLCFIIFLFLSVSRKPSGHSCRFGNISKRTADKSWSIPMVQ